MKVKKCGFLLSLLILVCFALPSFASAEEKRVNLLSGVKAYTDFNFTNQFVSQGIKVVGGSQLEFDIGSNGNGEEGIYYDLGVDSKVSGFEASTPGGSNISTYKPLLHIEYYNSKKEYIGFDNERLSKGGSFYGSKTIENVRYVKIKFYSSYNVSAKGFLDYLVIYGNKPFVLDEIKNLNVVEGVNDVYLTWDNPSNPSFERVRIYKDGSIIATISKSSKSNFKVEGLEPDKSYEFTIYAEYEGGKRSEGVKKTVKMKPKPKEPMPLVKPPENVIVTPQNGKMVIAWDDVDSPYLEGYNVYIDGKKVNDEPLKSNKLIVKGLENGKSYKVQISAINKENAEGDKSKAKEDKPSADALEVEYDVKMPFSVFDLLTSSLSLLALLGGFILLSIAIIWFKPIKDLIVKAARKGKDKK